MNNYFTEITTTNNLNLKQEAQALENIINAFKSHQSIQGFKLADFHCAEVFNFCFATEEAVGEEVKNEILNLLSKKARVHSS